MGVSVCPPARRLLPIGQWQWVIGHELADDNQTDSSRAVALGPAGPSVAWMLAPASLVPNL
ncbi:uncharacterized protein BO80DRAFT_421912 [Aspergillus ibericus CBS 121593]|uniref:Uncharacterized protein n=1 Tax=Aspergillus ibericus CBS 121593 TaxID=1448316 RepID=A0A395HAQ0_9EURO|nr:hypothetical protein BO80DRAFT_421912 [Aspergillus ibericus CBS 121593]RAL04649.1 hypothetical protein BO80DRAFT_421912 [Aspergillus ibericus CBS 121593]